jgi:GTPase SAR1 family protein
MQSFEMVQVIHDKILNHLVSLQLNLSMFYSNLNKGTEWVPVVVVGNKSDLRPEQRQVTAEDGKKLAEQYSCAWTEASARYNENVTKAFELIIGQIEKSQNPNEPTGGNKCSVM